MVGLGRKPATPSLRLQTHDGAEATRTPRPTDTLTQEQVCAYLFSFIVIIRLLFVYWLSFAPTAYLIWTLEQPIVTAGQTRQGYKLVPTPCLRGTTIKAGPESSKSAFDVRSEEHTSELQSP